MSLAGRVGGWFFVVFQSGWNKPSTIKWTVTMGTNDSKEKTNNNDNVFIVVGGEAACERTEEALLMGFRVGTGHWERPLATGLIWAPHSYDNPVAAARYGCCCFCLWCVSLGRPPWHVPTYVYTLLLLFLGLLMPTPASIHRGLNHRPPDLSHWWSTTLR